MMGITWTKHWVKLCGRHIDFHHISPYLWYQCLIMVAQREKNNNEIFFKSLGCFLQSLDSFQVNPGQPSPHYALQSIAFADKMAWMWGKQWNGVQSWSTAFAKNIGFEKRNQADPTQRNNELTLICKLPLAGMQKLGLPSSKWWFVKILPPLKCKFMILCFRDPILECLTHGGTLCQQRSGTAFLLIF